MQGLIRFPTLCSLNLPDSSGLITGPESARTTTANKEPKQKTKEE